MEADVAEPVSVPEAVSPTVETPLSTEILKTCSQCHESKAKTAFKKDSDPPLCTKCHRARLQGKAIALADADASLPWVTQTLKRVERLTLASLDQLEAKLADTKSPKDLALTAAILIDKRALLRGEPTQIVSHTDRESVIHMARLIAAEKERREKAKVIEVVPA